MMKDIKKMERNEGAKGDVISRSYMQAGNSIGKYVGQEALFAPKKNMKDATIGPNGAGQGSGYSGLTSIY